MINSPNLVAKEVCDGQETHPDLLAKAIPNLPDEREASRLADLFKALSDPTRVRIIAALLNTELCVDDLANLLDMSQSAISHQLRLLRNLHLVQFRRSGKHAFYRLVDDHVRDLFQRSREHLDC